MPDGLKETLDTLAERYQDPSFIEHDPIAIPHGFDDPADREIIGLFAALLAWGRRSTILAKLNELCERMDYRPARFILSFDREKANRLEGFKHRTFSSDDARWLSANLSLLLRRHKTVENCWAYYFDGHIRSSIEGFSNELLTIDSLTPVRMRKHLARPSTGSACKRLSMYARWMVRKGPFDFGQWESFSASDLVLPLDVHSGTQARAVGLLDRKQNDWKATMELTTRCRFMDPDDPCKYDFALFGAGVYGGLEEFYSEE